MAMSHRLGLVLLVMLVILATSFYQIQCTDSVQVSIHGDVCSIISNRGNCFLLKRAYLTHNIVYCLGLDFGTFTYPPLEAIFFMIMHFVEVSYKPY